MVAAVCSQDTAPLPASPVNSPANSLVPRFPAPATPLQSTLPRPLTTAHSKRLTQNLSPFDSALPKTQGYTLPLFVTTLEPSSSNASSIHLPFTLLRTRTCRTQWKKSTTHRLCAYAFSLGGRSFSSGKKTCQKKQLPQCCASEPPLLACADPVCCVLWSPHPLCQVRRDRLEMFQVPGVNGFGVALSGALQQQSVINAPASNAAFCRRADRFVILLRAQRHRSEPLANLFNKQCGLFRGNLWPYGKRREHRKKLSQHVLATSRLLGRRWREQLQTGRMMLMIAPETCDQHRSVEKPLHFKSSRMRSSRTASICSCSDSVAGLPLRYTHTPRSFFSVACARTGRNTICWSFSSTRSSSPASSRSLSRVSFGRTTRPALSMGMALMDAILRWKIPFVNGVYRSTKRLFPSALGKLTPAKCASVGAMSRISIRPRFLFFGTPPPTTKNDDRSSGKSFSAPCVPLTFVGSRIGAVNELLVLHPGFSPTKKDAVAFEHAVNSIRRIPRDFCKQFAHLHNNGSVLGIFQHNCSRSARRPRKRLPVFRIPFCIQRDQSLFHKRRRKTQLLVHFHEAVVAHHTKNHASRKRLFRRRAQSPNRNVFSRDHFQSFRRKGIRIVFRMVQRAQMQQKELRIFLLQNPLRIPHANFIRVNRSVNPAAIRTDLFFRLIQQARRGRRTHPLDVVFIGRAPDFRDVPRHFRADRHWPLDRRRRPARRHRCVI